MILLYSEATTDSAVTMPGRIWNEAHPPRRYQAQGHYLVLEGPGHIISYDAEELCKNPIWRLATAAEQQAYAKLTRRASQLEEALPPPPALPDVPAEPAPPEAPQPHAEETAARPVAPVPQVMTTATAPKSAGGKG